MDRNMLMVVVSVLVSIVVLWFRHSGKKLKFPSWKKMVLVGLLIFVVWYNWIDIKKGLNKFWVERMAENVSFLNQKSKTGIAQEKLRDLEEKAKERPLTSEEVASLEATKKEMGVIPSPSQRQIVVETIDLPAGKIVETNCRGKNKDRMEVEKFPPGNSCYWIVGYKKTKITSDYFAAEGGRCRNPETGDPLILQGDPHKDLKLTIKIIPGYYLNR